MSLRNNRGFLAADFIFSMILVMGFGSILFAVSLTLTTVEITQYIAFSTARTFFAGHINSETQGEIAIQKYVSLVESDAFGPLLHSSWFDAPPLGPSGMGDHTTSGKHNLSHGATYSPSSSGLNMFYGISVNLLMPLMALNVPFFGPTSRNLDEPSGGFSSVLTAFLGREITQKKCSEFVRDRLSRILTLHSSYNTASSGSTNYTPVVDNGC